MKEAKDVLRMVGTVFLVLVALVLVLPPALEIVGLTFGIFGFLIGILIWLALKLIYAAVIVAVMYLVIVVIRAALR